MVATPRAGPLETKTPQKLEIGQSRTHRVGSEDLQSEDEESRHAVNLMSDLVDNDSEFSSLL